MLRIGTSGWNYAHWRDKFYPRDSKPRDYLSYYAHHFPTVEINYSFYRLPKISTYQNWYDQTPKNFIFAVKASRFITHIKRLKNSKTAFKTFLKNASSLKEKLGPILFQFPPSFKATEENIKRLENFLKVAKVFSQSEARGASGHGFPTTVGKSERRKPASEHAGGASGSLEEKLLLPLRLAFEFRHPSWCNEKIYKLLKKYNAAWVMADSPNYPKAEVVTADFIYIRMHGSRVLFGSKYTEKELNDLAQKIKKWQKKVKDIFIYFNNDFSGFAVENAKQLQGMLLPNCLS